MVTGDSVETATSIAKEANILAQNAPEDHVMTGETFEKTVGKIIKICSGCKRALEICKCKPEVQEKRAKKNKKA